MGILKINRLTWVDTDITKPEMKTICRSLTSKCLARSSESTSSSGTPTTSTWSHSNSITFSPSLAVSRHLHLQLSAQCSHLATIRDSLANTTSMLITGEHSAE